MSLKILNFEEKNISKVKIFIIHVFCCFNKKKYFLITILFFNKKKIMIIKRNILKNLNNLNKKLKKFISRDNLHFLINFFFLYKNMVFY